MTKVEQIPELDKLEDFEVLENEATLFFPECTITLKYHSAFYKHTDNNSHGFKGGFRDVYVEEYAEIYGLTAKIDGEDIELSDDENEILTNFTTEKITF